MIKLNINAAVMQLADKMSEGFTAANLSPAFSEPQARRAMRDLARIGKLEPCGPGRYRKAGK